MFITKYRHNKIVAEYQKVIDDLRGALNRKMAVEEMLGKLTDKVVDISASCSGDISMADIKYYIKNDDSIPMYVDDVLGGRVIKQEATPVTILDTNGKATYGYTKKEADKNRSYKLIQK